MVEEIICPNCEAYRKCEFVERMEVYTIRGEGIPVNAKLHRCLTCGEDFDGPGSNDVLEIAYKEYERLHGVYPGLRRYEKGKEHMKYYLMLTDYPIIINRSGTYLRQEAPPVEELRAKFDADFTIFNRIVDKKLEKRLFEYMEVDKDVVPFSEESLVVKKDDELHFIVVEPLNTDISVHCVKFTLS